ncbi:aldose 1-epimerase [Amylibacter ulvae]|uniref:Aldose 1-epimerase n=1 Tax=Paramylibacter ulvae TaxID=1651968 RepID=A0ABQ3D613_9RHOB|nr:aldose epimerase family protein [Amylibacter ulvae]GHA58708.1 aldose 1-epimerase [Amylibacter ulvae]
MVQVDKFGDIDGAPVWCATLKSDTMMVQVLSFGATTKSLQRQGQNLILGYADLQGYVADQNHMGVIAGRVANRTAYGAFSLNGKPYQLECNNGAHHLHGGATGFGRRVWDLEKDSHDNAIQLRLHSPHLDAGYPETVDVSLKITLKDSTLAYELDALPSGETPINLAQHNYYNLGGKLSDHTLQVNATGRCEVDDTLIPTGIISPMSDTYFNELTRSKIDHNFVLRHNDEPSAVFIGEHSKMEIYTDQPGLQVYTGHGLSPPFSPYDALCLEPQYFPDCLNQPTFQSCIHSPDLPYSQKTTLAFSKPT